MTKKINFVVPPPDVSLYSKILLSIIDPIRVHLPESQISPACQEGAVNVHFFNEEWYLRTFFNCENSTSVFYPHGMADKGWRDGPIVKVFDFVCVSGPLWVEKMVKEGIPKERVLMVGYSKLDPLFRKRTGKTNERVDPRGTVLYAPTHERSAPCTSFPAFLKYLERFPEDLRVLSCAHPYHREDNEPVLQELEEADVVISDASSMIYEALALGKPVVFPDWLVKDHILNRWPHSFTAQIYRRGIGYHAKDFDHLADLVCEALERKLKPEDVQFIDGIFPPVLRGNSGKITAGALRELSKTACGNAPRSNKA